MHSGNEDIYGDPPLPPAPRMNPDGSMQGLAPMQSIQQYAEKAASGETNEDDREDVDPFEPLMKIVTALESLVEQLQQYKPREDSAAAARSASSPLASEGSVTRDHPTATIPGAATISNPPAPAKAPDPAAVQGQSPKLPSLDTPGNLTPPTAIAAADAAPKPTATPVQSEPLEAPQTPKAPADPPKAIPPSDPAWRGDTSSPGAPAPAATTPEAAPRISPQDNEPRALPPRAPSSEATPPEVLKPNAGNSQAPPPNPPQPAQASQSADASSLGDIAVALQQISEQMQTMIANQSEQTRITESLQSRANQFLEILVERAIESEGSVARYA